MAEATTSPIYDRHLARRSGDACEDLVVGDVAIPRRGDATIVVDERAIALTNLDRLLYPEASFTKADSIAYHLAMAPVLLAHLRDRALTVGRFPGGVDGRGFAQVEIPGRPAWIPTIRLMLAKGEEKAFTRVDQRATLVWLAQMGTIELHTFLGRATDLETPTQVVLDLDPTSPAGLLEAAQVALLLRDRLVGLGLAPLVKTSGSIGMHVVLPLADARGHAETRAFAQHLAKELAEAHPERVSDRLERAGRAGKVLVDARQNARRLTMVVPYSLRSTPRPNVSTPVTWEEIEKAVAGGDAASLVFEADQVVRRVASIGDLFAPML
jgi:bifunctional non-homologous end joining protein LigD